MASGRAYSGSGFVEAIDTSLYDVATLKHIQAPHVPHNRTVDAVTGATWEEIKLRTTFENYDKSLALAHQCAVEKVRSIRDSGWIDELTRAVFVEYCTAPYWSIVPHDVNRNMGATLRWERESDASCNYFVDQDGTHTGTGHCTLVESVGACHRVVFEQNRYGRVTSTQAVMTARADSEPGDLYFKGILLMVICIIGLSLTFLIETTEFFYAFTSEERRKAFFSLSSMFWNVLDALCMVGLLWTLSSFPFDHQPFSPASLQFNEHQDEGMGWQPVYTQFDTLQSLENTRFWFAVTSLLWYIRGVEYFGVFPALQLPVIAIWYSMGTVVSFLSFFGMLLVGASMCFRFLFGSSSPAFADLTSSTMSMLMASVGEFRTEEIMVDYRHADAEFWMLMWAIVMSFIVSGGGGVLCFFFLEHY